MGVLHDHPLQESMVPYCMRLKGSVLSRVWIQVLLISVFSASITCISELTSINLGIQSTMISTLGFVVGLSLSFRTTSAYANWKEARQAWDKLASISRNLVRLIWIHGPENETSEDLLRKKSAINLLAAFAFALKHHLREERGHEAADVRDLIPHLNTFSLARQVPVIKPSLGQSYHRLFRPHKHDTTALHTIEYGCLPVDINFHLAGYLDFLKQERAMDVQSFGQAVAQMSGLMDVMATCERILRSPVPLAYDIVIAQLVWVFMLFLPFQLQTTLGWISIPATIITGAMLFGMAEIGLEIKNPFGFDANDLDLDEYAQHIALELDTLTATPRPHPRDWAEQSLNRPLFPYSDKNWNELKTLPVVQLQELFRQKALATAANTTIPMPDYHDCSTSSLKSITIVPAGGHPDMLPSRLAGWSSRRPSVVVEAVDEDYAGSTSSGGVA